MATWKDVTTIGLALPKTEVSTWYGTPGMKVAGKGFLRLRTEAEGGLVVLCDHDKKGMLLGSGDPAFFTTPHYDGYPSILVDLQKVKRSVLKELIVEVLAQKGAPQAAPRVRRSQPQAEALVRARLAVAWPMPPRRQGRNCSQRSRTLDSSC